MTLIRFTFFGVVKFTGPEISVMFAPRSANASAIANPIFPELWLEI